MKRESIQKLKDLYMLDARKKHPNVPYLYPYPYHDRTANALTKCIIDYIKLSGYQAERISVTGRLINKQKIVTDVLGHKRLVGSVKYIKSSMQPGTADISATINGRSIKIEIKKNRDKQSDAQKKYQQEVERAGGIYVIIHNFDEFIDFFERLITEKNEKN